MPDRHHRQFAKSSSPKPPRVSIPVTQHVPTSSILQLVGATLLFISLDVVMKYLGGTHNVVFLLWVRYSMQALLTVAWLYPRSGMRMLRTGRPVAHVIRGSLLAASSLLFFSALMLMPMAETTALNYLSPVIVVIGAATLLGEKITPARWVMLVGCIGGMLLIVRPGAPILGPGVAFALGSAVVYASFQLLTRELADENPETLLLVPSLMGASLLSILVPFFWDSVSIPWSDLALLLFTGILSVMGQFLFIEAFRKAPASALTPFTYAQLVWATLFGWLFFNQLPDPLAFAGIVVIAASGVALALRERALKRQAIAADMAE